ncbi:MAG: hypothetical protein ACHQUC_08615, partial [Chlamydiales bacterium]
LSLARGDHTLFLGNDTPTSRLAGLTPLFFPLFVEQNLLNEWIPKKIFQHNRPAFLVIIPIYLVVG